MEPTGESYLGASPAPPHTLDGCGALQHCWPMTSQACSLEAIPCLAAGLLLSFPSPPFPLISFLALAELLWFQFCSFPT